MAIAQVVMYLIYIILKRNLRDKQIVDIGAFLMVSSLILLIVYPGSYAYCTSTLILGFGMAVRQLISENTLISTYEGDKLSKTISSYNSLISLAYLLGYFMSAFQDKIASVKVYFIISAFCLLSPILINQIKSIIIFSRKV